MIPPALTTLDRLVGEGATVISVAPVGLSGEQRPLPLDVRISAPATGTDLPIVIFSHGNGSSHDHYAPLTSFWASRGFVVIQPTHLDSRRHGITFDDPRFPTIWLQRIEDITRILDQLDTIENAVPGLTGRVNRHRIAAAGHSWGAQTVQSLLGARTLDKDGQIGQDRSDQRIMAGILLAATGTGGKHLHPFTQQNFPFMYPSFAELTTPALVVAGDHDQSRMSSRGPEWYTDAYTLSPGATDLITLIGAGHDLGGITSHDTTDENNQHLAVLQRMTTAYLRSALLTSNDSWAAARAATNDDINTLGHVQHK